MWALWRPAGRTAFDAAVTQDARNAVESGEGEAESIRIAPEAARALFYNRASPEDAQAALYKALAPWAPADTQDLSARIQAAHKQLEATGHFVLGGTTPPLKELMVWRKQTEVQQTVGLPSGPISVKVSLLDDFISLGWAAWGTCDRSHTGGWTGALERLEQFAQA